jgi:hypothetical protein
MEKFMNTEDLEQELQNMKRGLKNAEHRGDREAVLFIKERIKSKEAMIEQSKSDAALKRAEQFVSF